MKRFGFAVIAAVVLLSGCAEKEKIGDNSSVSSTVSSSTGSSVSSTSSKPQSSATSSTTSTTTASASTIQSSEISSTTSTVPVAPISSTTTVSTTVPENDPEEEESEPIVIEPETPSDSDESEIYGVLMSFKSKYPEGTSWTNENRSYKSYSIYPQYSFYEGRGCAAFALELSDAAFGELPAEKHYDADRVRVGDIIRMDGDTHFVIVLEVNSDGIVVAEGNFNKSVHWGREISTSELESDLTYILTRYP